MNNRCTAFDAKNANEEEIFAIEALVFSAQIALQKAMHDNCVSRKELAERLGWSPARISQILSASASKNLTFKTVAKIAHALGDEFGIVSKKEIEMDARKVKKLINKNEKIDVGGIVIRPNSWIEFPANDNDNREARKLA